MEFHKENRKQKHSTKTKLQLNNLQFSTPVDKMVHVINQSCQSLDSLLNNQFPISKCSRSNETIANTQHYQNQRIAQGDLLAIRTSKGNSFENQKLSTSGKIFKKSKTSIATRVLKSSGNKSKEMIKISKSKTNGLTRYRNSEKLDCYAKGKSNIGNNCESAVYQVRPINTDIVKSETTKREVNAVKKRINDFYGTYSPQNINVVCYESNYKLINDKTEEITTVISSLNFIENKMLEKKDHFPKLFKVSSSTQQKMTLCNQRDVDGMIKEITSDYTLEDYQEKFSEPISLQREHLKSKQTSDLMFTNKIKENTKMLSNNFCSRKACERNNQSHLLFRTGNKQEGNRKSFNKFIEDYYVNNVVHKENDSTVFTSNIRKQDETKLPNSVSEKNVVSSNTVVEKIKQQIVKLAEKIVPTITDSLPEVNYTNTLIIDEIKLQEMVKLFNANSRKTHKDINNNSTQSTNLLYSREQEINKLDHNHLNASSGDLLFTCKSNKKINQVSFKNLDTIPKEKNILNKSEIKQKQTLKFYDNCLLENLGMTRKKSSLPLRKIVQYESLTPVESKNVNHSLIINVNAKPNYEVNKSVNKNEIKIKKDPQSCSEFKTTPKLRLNEKTSRSSFNFESMSTLNVPFVVSIKSIPKINIEKVRPNSKFSLKNTLLQNDGIYHPNKRIKNQIEELGIKNMSQTPSSSKFSRKTVSYEKPRAELPYQVSLMSLPEDATNMNFMAKPSTKENVHRKFNNLPEKCLSKLNYYSNLETGFKRRPRNTYEVRYFQLKTDYQSEDKPEPPPTKDIEQNKSDQKDEQQQTDSKSEKKIAHSTTEYSKYIPPWGQSFEVRVFEYANKGSDTDLPMAMSSKNEAAGMGATTTQRRSKYYSYPDEDEYLRNARMKAERRPEDPRQVYKRPVPVERNVPGGPHVHGESRLGLEPWAPFSISDTSLPGLRNTKNKQNPNYQGQGPGPTSVPPVFPEKSSTMSKPKESGVPNKPSTGINQTGGMSPVMLTPDLLEKIRALDMDRVPHGTDVGSGFKNRNFPCGSGCYDLPNNGNMKCCPATRCTVSTDTDDLHDGSPKPLKCAIDNLQLQKKRSLCPQCEVGSSQTVPQNPSSRTCTPKQSSTHGTSKTCTPKQSNTLKNCQPIKETPKNDKPGQLPHTCGILKDMCLCGYTGNCKGACGSKPPKENENKNQNNKSNTPSCSHGKASNGATDSQQRKSTSGCFKTYNNNPHVMYYLGEQRNKNYVDNHPQTTGHDKFQIPSKLPSSLEHSLMAKDVSPINTSLHTPQQKPIAEQKKSIKYQENIIQFCLEPQSTPMKVVLPLRQKLDSKTDLSQNKVRDGKQQYELRKIQTDKYYVLCLPNETSFNNKKIFHDNCNLTCFPQSELIVPNTSELDNMVFKQNIRNKTSDESHSQFDITSKILKSRLNSNTSQETRLVRSKKKLLTSSSSADESWTEKFNDSTIYVFQAEPNVHNNKFNQQKRLNVIKRTVISPPESDIPIKEKTIINVNQMAMKLDKESNTHSVRERKLKSQSNPYNNQAVKNKDDELRYYLFEQSESANKVENTKSNIYKHSYKKLKVFKDGYKHNILLVDDSQSTIRESSKNNLYVVDKKSSCNNEITKHVQYCSIGINTDSVPEVSEVLTNQSCSDVSISPDSSAELPKTVNGSLVKKQQFLMQGSSQQPNILLKQFRTNTGYITTEAAANRVLSEKNKLIIKRSGERVDIPNHRTGNIIKEYSNNKENSTKHEMCGCLPQNVKCITGTTNTAEVSSFSIKHNSKEIQVNRDTSKYSIIISQLADASSCTDSIPPQCLKDVTNRDTAFISKKKSDSSGDSVEIDAFYCDSDQLPTFSTKSTQSPPVVYRSKISDFIKKDTSECQTTRDFFNTKSDRKSNSFNSVNLQTHNYNEGEYDNEKSSKTVEKCIRPSLQTGDHREYNSPIGKSILYVEQCNLVNRQLSNVMKNTEKAGKINTNCDKENQSSVEYVTRSQQTEDATNDEVTCSMQPISTKVDDNKNTCGLIKKHEVSDNVEIFSDKEQIINEILKTIMPKSSSSNVISTPTIVPLENSNNDAYTEVYRSRLFACNSLLSLPIQFPNKKCAFGTTSFWIPPDYDDSEFNVYASESKISDYLSFKNNNHPRNASRQSSHVSVTNAIESMGNTDTDSNILTPYKSLNIASNKLIKDKRNHSFVTSKEREKQEKVSFPSRIVPVTLAMSQEKCQKVSSGPIIPVVLSNSQQEYQKDYSSAPEILPLLKCVNNSNSTALTKAEKSSTSQKESKSKRLADDRVNDSLNYNEEQMSETKQLDENQDKIYWALTRVKTHRDGSQDLEILDATPIPPGHFLVPTDNNVVLVEDQPYISAENKEADRK